MSTETINWIKIEDSDDLPDAESTVLIRCLGASEPVWPGWFDGEGWIWIEGAICAYPVTHWADMPKGPE